jgi:aminoglycoside N3'-acetyltransferase
VAETTPVDPDIGVFAEVFRTHPGTISTNHPEGRFAARGARADELFDDVPWNDYYGPDSPLERFVNMGGKVLRLGADLDTVTLLHYAEYIAPVANQRRVRRHRLVTTSDVPRVRTVECLDDSYGLIDPPGEDDFATITRAYLATGRGSTAGVGNAVAELIDGRDLVDFAATWMGENLVPLTPDDDLALVKQRTVELLDPEVRADRNALDWLFHLDFVEIGASGRLWNRSDVIAELFRSPDAGPIEVTDLEARHITNDVIVVLYRTQSTVRGAARSAWWVRDQGYWKILFEQGTVQPTT